MSISKSDWQEEQERLEKVLEQVRMQLAEKSDGKQIARTELIHTQKSMWEHINPTPTDLDDLANIWQYQVDMDRQGQKYKFSELQVKRLEKLLKSPYFGRIDFKEDGEDYKERIYIGISTLMNERTHVISVYDWRAPVSSMFYDYETGKAAYKCPAGLIKGEMLLKRQYRISGNEINYMFDSSIKIDDEILQEILSRSVDDKMRTIVTTIQREQNRVIRDESHKLLIVQGPAGSGKTSIALHRIAFLLYRYRESVTADNIVIFSPNQVFNDYISDVLPELGEENMLRTTFMEYASNALDKGITAEDMSMQMEYLLSKRRCPDYETRIESIKLKASYEFSRAIRRYVDYLEKEAIVFNDIIYNGATIISKEEATRLFLTDYAILPVIKRLAKIRKYILNELITPYEKERMAQVELELADTGEYVDADEIRARSILLVREEFKPVKAVVEAMTGLSPWNAYKKLFEDTRTFVTISGDDQLPENFEKICALTIESLNHNVLRYEDIAPFLLLKGMLGELANMSGIKHVIIDEAQDYTAMQLEILKSLFRDSTFTLLGDLNQAINSYMNVGNYEKASSVFAEDSVMMIELSKSYRSTMEITAFSKALLNVSYDKDESVNRSGDKPEVIKVDNAGKMHLAVSREIRCLKDSGCRSIAVICKTTAESELVYAAIKKDTGAALVTRDDEEYTQGVVVIPSYLAKGLEFDAVLVCGAGEMDYSFEDERKLLYTACTRALHQLRLYYSGQLSPFIQSIGPEFYKLVG